MMGSVSRKLSALWARRDYIFIAAVAAALCFGLGMWTQAYREDVKTRETLADDLRWTVDSLRPMDRLCQREDDTPFAAVSSARTYLSYMRYNVAKLEDALVDNGPVRKKYPEACLYLQDLGWYLLRADYPDAESLTPVLDLSRPLRASYDYNAELSENLAALEAWLAAEEGTAVLSVLRNESTN